MRCPGRGRKLIYDHKQTWIKKKFGNEMPRKGTETLKNQLFGEIYSPFGNEMPRKGTETKNGMPWEYIHTAFGNEMPRKGTETVLGFDFQVTTKFNLEMRCPGRGRKPVTASRSNPATANLEMRCPGRGRKPKMMLQPALISAFGNEMPRKGTETFRICNSLKISSFIWK